MADAGQLVCVLAGPSAAVDKVKPYTTGVMGRAIIDFGGQPHGRATLLKVIGNTFILNMVETLSEGHVVAEKSGLGVDNLHQFIETMFPGPYTAYSTRLRSGDYYKREEVLFPMYKIREVVISDSPNSRCLPSTWRGKTLGTHWRWQLPRVRS